MVSGASISEVLGKLANVMMSNPFTFFFASLLFALFLYRWLLTITKPRKVLPPSPPRLPIIGNMHQLAAGSLPHRSLQSLSQKYGKLMLLKLGSMPTLVISSADVAEQIMKNHDQTFSSRPPLCIFKSFTYGGKDVGTAPYGKNWRQGKSMLVLRLLSNTRVRSYRDIREEETALLVEKICNNGSSSPINLSEMVAKLTDDVVCRVVLGGKYDADEDGGVKRREVMRKLTELAGAFDIRDCIPSLGWISTLTGLAGKVDRAAKASDQFLEAVVQEHVDRLTHQNYDGRDEDGGGQKIEDVVDIMLKIQMENEAGFQMDREHMKGILTDIFVAGNDTTHVLLEWTMTELLRHPHVMKKVQDEIRTATKGTKTGEILSEHDLENLKYLKAVIKESLRLHPPFPLLVPRATTEDVNVNGFDIAAGTHVIFNSWAIQRDPAFWEDPETFCPERFQDSHIDFRGQDPQFIPFGSGRRICPGISFAHASAELVLANLLGNFKWTLPGGAKGEDLDMTEAAGLTVHKFHPLLLVATPYSGN